MQLQHQTLYAEFLFPVTWLIYRDHCTCMQPHFSSMHTTRSVLLNVCIKTTSNWSEYCVMSLILNTRALPVIFRFVKFCWCKPKAAQYHAQVPVKCIIHQRPFPMTDHLLYIVWVEDWCEKKERRWLYFLTIPQVFRAILQYSATSILIIIVTIIVLDCY